MGRLAVRHLAGDRYEIRVGAHRLVVDQPIDAGGEDAGPTPTELFVASLASCVAFYAGRFLRRHGAGEGEVALDCAFAMSDEAPWRVTRVDLRLHVPDGLTEEVRQGALRAAEHCTVHNSLRAAPAVHLALAAAEPARATS